MTNRLTTDHLVQANDVFPAPEQIICLVLAHNEMAILPDFLRYYRGVGNVHFVIVDDRSDDGTHQFLVGQGDVTLFHPRPGSTYAEHKRAWRSELLDAFAEDQWAIVADVDERLIWRDFENRPLTALIASIEAAGAEALYCTMLDMYKEGGLVDQLYSGQAALEAEFKLYDDPRKDPLSHRFMAAPSRFLKRWPVPSMIMYGGMRDRMFFRSDTAYYPWSAFVFSRLPTLRNVQPKGVKLAFERFMKPFLGRRRTTLPPINLTKIPLIKWRKGLQFYGGAHAISAPLALAQETGVVLHFPITRGIEQVRYIAARGQHAAGGAYYQKLVDEKSEAAKSIRYSGTSQFSSSRDVEPFFNRKTDG